MLLFIHGFGSCGWGRKSLCLRRHFGVPQLLAPDLPFHPDNAMARLREMVERLPITALVGSSLGGFYATVLGGATGLPAVLINPVAHPQALFDRFRGPQRRWCDDVEFEVDASHLAALQRLDRDALRHDERYLVLLQTGDETLDYREAAEFYRAKDLVLIEGGSHRFDGLERWLPLIEAWLDPMTEPGRSGA